MLFRLISLTLGLSMPKHSSPKCAKNAQQLPTQQDVGKYYLYFKPEGFEKGGLFTLHAFEEAAVFANDRGRSIQIDFDGRTYQVGPKQSQIVIYEKDSILWIGFGEKSAQLLRCR